MSYTNEIFKAIETIQNPTVKRELTDTKMAIVGTVLNGLEAKVIFRLENDNPYWVLRGSKSGMRVDFFVDGHRLFYNLDLQEEDYKAVADAITLIEDFNEEANKKTVGQLYKALEL
jgi:hypothetical protein